MFRYPVEGYSEALQRETHWRAKEKEQETNIEYIWNPTNPYLAIRLNHSVIPWKKAAPGMKVKSTYIVIMYHIVASC